MKRLTGVTVVVAGIGAVAGIFGMSEARTAFRLDEGPASGSSPPGASSLAGLAVAVAAPDRLDLSPGLGAGSRVDAGSSCTSGRRGRRCPCRRMRVGLGGGDHADGLGHDLKLGRRLERPLRGLQPQLVRRGVCGLVERGTSRRRGGCTWVIS